MNKKGEMIGRGNTAEIFNWNEDCVLKLYRSGLPEFLCQDEFDRTLAAYELTKTSPKPIEIICYDGRAGAIYQKLNGKTMLNQMISKPWLSGKYAKQLAFYHTQIQKSLNNNKILPDVKDKLKYNIEKTDSLTLEEKKYIYDYIDVLPCGNVMCHFDFHPDNVMLSDGSYSIIDWMTACKGDKLSDVARTCVILKYAYIPHMPAVANYIMSIFQKYVLKKYLKEYMRITNEHIEDIKKWELPIAAARLFEWIPEQEKRKLLNFIKESIQ